MIVQVLRHEHRMQRLINCAGITMRAPLHSTRNVRGLMSAQNCRVRELEVLRPLDINPDLRFESSGCLMITLMAPLHAARTSCLR